MCFFCFFVFVLVIYLLLLLSSVVFLFSDYQLFLFFLLSLVLAFLIVHIISLLSFCFVSAFLSHLFMSVAFFFLIVTFLLSLPFPAPALLAAADLFLRASPVTLRWGIPYDAFALFFVSAFSCLHFPSHFYFFTSRNSIWPRQTAVEDG